MPLFAPPITDLSRAPTSRRHLSSIARNKRKRAPPSETSDDEKSVYAETITSVAASTNPLSLRPEEVIQYRLSGLELNEELPQLVVPDFPHRKLPPGQHDQIHERSRKRALSNADGEDTDVDGESEGLETTHEVKVKKSTKPGLKIQHLSVLTAILQRCLQENDIPRASRAWSLLLHTQIGGQPIDIRTSGYWGIGAELLARSLDDHKQSIQEIGTRVKERRWGTGEGLKKACEYYQTLINTYPYVRLFADRVGALDFWCAMLGCKIYELQLTQRESLRQLEEAGVREDEEDLVEDSDHAEVSHAFGNNRDFANEELKRHRRQQRREDIRWKKRDEIRQTALAASESISATLTDLMISKEYYSLALRRFRGMLVVYVGHLSVPEKPEDHEKEEENEGLSSNEVFERREKLRERMRAYDQGREKQQAEENLAKEIFKAIKDDGGYIGGNVDFLFPEDDEFYDAEEW